MRVPEGLEKVECSDFESLLDHTTAKNRHLQLWRGLLNGVDYCGCPLDKHVAVAALPERDNKKHLQLKTLLQCLVFIDEFQLFLSLLPSRTPTAH